MRTITRYDFEFLGVKVFGVEWKYNTKLTRCSYNVFYFEKDNYLYIVTQKDDFSFVSDIDYIKYIIKEKFLPELGEK